MGKLEGKTAIVTGANRGIGRAIAERFAMEGCATVLAARGAEELEATAQMLRDKAQEAIACPTDVTDERQVEALFKTTLERFGQVDILVNNAGAFDGGPLDELSLDAWEHVMAVNLRGPFLCTREAMRVMKPQRQGRILNIGSISAQRVRPGSAAYSASKHGLWGLTQVTALEGRDFGVTSGCLHPGNVAVERRETDKPEDAEPMIAPASIAEVALTMASLGPDVEMLETIVLPSRQLYVGRG